MAEISGAPPLLNYQGIYSEGSGEDSARNKFRDNVMPSHFFSEN